MTTHNGDNVNNDKINKQINKLKIFVSLNKGLFAIAFALVVVGLAIITSLFIPKTEITPQKVINDRYFTEKDKDFKIIILHFGEICNDTKDGVDVGYAIEQRLNGIIVKEKLKVKVKYFSEINSKNLNGDETDSLRKYHYADMIVYGNYKAEACAGNEEGICVNFRTDDKHQLDTVGRNTNTSSENYIKGGLKEIETGKIQAKVENIAIFVSVLAQEKSYSTLLFFKYLIMCYLYFFLCYIYIVLDTNT
jgi:hypothetical protein